MNILTRKKSDYIMDNTPEGEYPVVVIPQWLFSEKPYSKLSDRAKLTYALLLQRTFGPDILNGYAVIGMKLKTPTMDKVQCMLSCRKRIAQKVISELTEADLVAANI